jgi:ABC-type polysaccharide/polyol phosphate export permease
MRGFGVFLLSGLAPYLALQEVAARSAGFARQQAALVSRIAIPLEVLLGGMVLAVFVRHAVALGLVLVFSAATGLIALSHLPWLLLGFVLVPLVAWGLALLLSVLGAYLPDVSQVVTTGSLVVFFLTPIAYGVESLPPAVRPLVVANPLYDLVALVRAVTVGVSPTVVEVVVAAGAALLLWLLGSLVFARRAHRVPDLV